MQRAGKQQQRQHALHEHVGEIDRAQQRLFVLAQAVRHAQRVQPDERQREDQRGHHHADRRRQADEAMVQVGQQRGDDQAGGGNVEHSS